MRGISTVIATALLIAAVTSLGAIYFAQWVNQLEAEGATLSELFSRESEALGKKLSAVYVALNESGLSVFLYNYGNRDVEVSQVYLNSNLEDPSIMVWNESENSWKSSRVIEVGQLSLFFFPNERALLELEIIDSSGAILRVGR